MREASSSESEQGVGKLVSLGCRIPGCPEIPTHSKTTGIDWNKTHQRDDTIGCENMRSATGRAGKVAVSCQSRVSGDRILRRMSIPGFHHISANPIIFYAACVGLNPLKPRRPNPEEAGGWKLASSGTFWAGARQEAKAGGWLCPVQVVIFGADPRSQSGRLLGHRSVFAQLNLQGVLFVRSVWSEDREFHTIRAKCAGA